ncbi:SMP-30/gluconolactonase/LRE family protein [Paraglaciecola sp. L3A3]|uniref:SMP-30/gluconolactonase/LRE family protein n=1 Tax=Paraglaciecola sp. L3A3 TaxID=2686358 RepID=UPI0018EED1CE|nr:SMP-30/gluconolactonase/LRE family protein [Paraglaciecola sp. L3A3]
MLQVVRHIVLITLLTSNNIYASAPAESNKLTATLFSQLPDNCPTPDAFDIAPDGSLTLTCPNYSNRKLEGELFSLDKNGNVTHLATVPRIDKNNKANPMGLAYGPDGALYVADSRGPKHGRILKLTFEGKKIVSSDIVASGLNPNGLRYHQGYLYATQPKMPRVKTTKSTSVVYRFKASDRNIKVTNTLADENIIFSVETQNPDRQFGLDGLVFDQKGHLYTTDFGDGIIYKLTLDQQKSVQTQELYAQVPNTVGVDGMAIDLKGNLYLAGFSQNQILKVNTQGAVSIIADYPDNDGSNGQLDQPADLIVYEDKLIISNFDLMVSKGMLNTKHSKPYTLSVIDLK